MGDITRNFSFSEFERSSTAAAEGIANVIPSYEVRAAIRSLTETVLQPLRDSLSVPLTIESGYRSAALNARVGGVESSQHRKGEAADIRTPFYRPVEVARRIVALDLPFDQLIVYPTFVHVSHRKRGRQRLQILYNSRYDGEKI